MNSKQNEMMHQIENNWKRVRWMNRQGFTVMNMSSQSMANDAKDLDEYMR